MICFQIVKRVDSLQLLNIKSHLKQLQIYQSSILQSMKRASERITSFKRQSWRKSSSAIIKPELSSAFKPIPRHPCETSIPVIKNIFEDLLQIVEKKIDVMEAHNFILNLQQRSKQLQQHIWDAWEPEAEAIHNSINSPEVEPEPIAIDFLCSSQKAVEKKLLKRQMASISAFNTPLKELKQKEKLCISSKQLGKKRSLRTGLIPLASVDCEEDIRCTLIQTYYRDKFAKQDSINQEQNMPNKQELTKILKKSNQREKQQYAFDYDGEKIPIISSNSIKSNPLKILKTVYKVHKDKAEFRHMKKANETIRTSKLPDSFSSNHFVESGSDLRELKKGIELNVKWTGKLQSIKLITQNQQVK